LEFSDDLSYCSEINPVIGNPEELSLPLAMGNKNFSFRYHNPDYSLENVNIYQNFSAYSNDNIIIDGIIMADNG
jgi:hypothetical protein